MAEGHNLAEIFFAQHFDNIKRLSKKYNVKVSFNNFKKLTLANLDYSATLKLEGVDYHLHAYTYLGIFLDNLDTLAEDSVNIGLCKDKSELYKVVLGSIRIGEDLFSKLAFLVARLLSSEGHTSEPIMCMTGSLFFTGILRSTKNIKTPILLISRSGGSSLLDEAPKLISESTSVASLRGWCCPINSATLGGMKARVVYDRKPSIVRAFIKVDTEGDLSKGQIKVELEGHDDIELRSNLAGDPGTLATFLLWKLLTRLSDNVAGYLCVKSNVELGTSRSSYFMLNSVKARFAIHQFTVCKVNVFNKDSKSIYVKPEYSVSQREVASNTSLSLNFGLAIISIHAHLRYIERRIRVEGKFDPFSYNNFKQFLLNNEWSQVSEEDRLGWDLSETDGHMTNRPNVRLFYTEDSDYVLAVDTVSRYLVTVLVKGYTATYNDLNVLTEDEN